MFDIGFSELVVIGVVALIVVGPKDLPMMFRTVGRFTGKARAMAREFTSAMNQAADESGMSDMKKDLNDLGKLTNPKKAGLAKIQEAADAFERWDPMAEAKTPAAASGPEATPETKPEGPATADLRAERQEMSAAIRAEAAARRETPPSDSTT